MKQLVCEMCGSNDLVKDGGVFVCQGCGCKYTVEEARKLMIERADAVESAVETAGNVSTSGSSNVAIWLDLARKAVEAQNGEQANDYADKILQSNPRIAEAWYIKGKAALLESTVGIDRQSEAMHYFKEGVDIVNSHLGSTSAEEIKLIHKIQRASTEMALTRAIVFANGYSNFQSQEGLQRLLSTRSICINVASSNAAAAAPIERSRDIVLERLTAAGMSKPEAESTCREILDYEIESGQMFAGVALTLQNTANAVGKASINSWEEGGGHIFDFYGLENANLEQGKRRERNAWNDYIDGLDDTMKIIEVAIDLYERPETAEFIVSENKLDSTIRECYDDLIYLQCHARDARTNRRYHNQLSNGNKVTTDGFFLEPSAQMQRNNQIAKWTTAKNAHDPVMRRAKERMAAEEAARKKRAKERMVAEEAARKKRDRARDLLSHKYYELHADDAKLIKTIDRDIDEAKRQENDRLKQMNEQSSLERSEIERLESEKAEVQLRCSEWSDLRVDALLEKTESDWQKPEVWDDIERDAAAKEQEIAKRKAEEEQEKAARAAKEAAEKAKKQQSIKWLTIAAAAVAFAVAGFFLFTKVVIPSSKYNAALAKADEGNYAEAIADLESLGDYSDARDQIAIVQDRKNQSEYQKGEALYESGSFEDAYGVFLSIDSYSDSQEMAKKCAEAAAKAAERDNDYDTALDWYDKAGNQDDASRLKYSYVEKHLDISDTKTRSYLQDLADAQYSDSAKLYADLYKIHFDVRLTRDCPPKYYNFGLDNEWQLVNSASSDWNNTRAAFFKSMYLGVKNKEGKLDSDVTFSIHRTDEMQGNSSNDLNGTREDDETIILTPDNYTNAVNDDGYVYYELLSIDPSKYESWVSTVTVVYNGTEASETLALK